MKPTTIRLAMLIALWTVVISSFVLSFAGVRELGIQAGYHPVLASLLPLCLDGLVMAGSITILDAELRGLGKRFGWTITLVGVCASVAANVATAASLGLTAQIVHAAPPVVLALALEAWLSTMRGDVRQNAATEAQEAAELAAELAAAERAAAKAAKAEAALKPKKKVPSAEAVQELVGQGLSQREAAARLKTSRSTVQRLIKVPAGEDPAWAADEQADAAA